MLGVCVAECAVCLVWHAEHPRVHIRSALRMYKQHVHMLYMWACCRHARRRFECTHGCGLHQRKHKAVFFLDDILLAPILMNLLFISLEISAILMN